MTILEYIKENNYESLEGKAINVSSKICYIHSNNFRPEKIADFKDTEARIKQGRKPNFRLYGGTKETPDMCYWIYPDHEVLDN